MTVCSFCHRGGKHTSDRCPLKTTISNYITVDDQQALDSVAYYRAQIRYDRVVKDIVLVCGGERVSLRWKTKRQEQ